MTTSKSHKEELISELRDKEYRHEYVSSHISNGIAFQIKTLREQRELSQKTLGVLANKKQEAISRLENPNYGNYSLKTLKELAFAFDVALVIRFVPFGNLVDWDLKLNTDSLKAISFEEDPYFKEKETTTVSCANITYPLGIYDNVISFKEYIDKKMINTPQSMNSVSMTAKA